MSPPPKDGRGACQPSFRFREASASRPGAAGSGVSMERKLDNSIVGNTCGFAQPRVSVRASDFDCTPALTPGPSLEKREGGVSPYFRFRCAYEQGQHGCGQQQQARRLWHGGHALCPRQRCDHSSPARWSGR